MQETRLPAPLPTSPGQLGTVTNPLCGGDTEVPRDSIQSPLASGAKPACPLGLPASLARAPIGDCFLRHPSSGGAHSTASLCPPAFLCASG